MYLSNKTSASNILFKILYWINFGCGLTNLRLSFCPTCTTCQVLSDCRWATMQRYSVATTSAWAFWLKLNCTTWYFSFRISQALLKFWKIQGNCMLLNLRKADNLKTSLICLIKTSWTHGNMFCKQEGSEKVKRISPLHWFIQIWGEVTVYN